VLPGGGAGGAPGARAALAFATAGPRVEFVRGPSSSEAGLNNTEAGLNDAEACSSTGACVGVCLPTLKARPPRPRAPAARSFGRSGADEAAQTDPENGSN